MKRCLLLERHVLGYALRDQGEVALHLHSHMQDEGGTPDERVHLISGCSHCLHLCGSGKVIRAQVMEAGPALFDSTVKHELINIYGNCGSRLDAQQVLDSMPTTGFVAWKALIAGYTLQGNLEPSCLSPIPQNEAA